MYNIESIKSYKYQNNSGMEVVFYNVGAQIYSIKINGQILTYTPENNFDKLTVGKYFGKIIGPIAGRIFQGELTIDSDNRIFLKNKLNEKGITLLHGSDQSFAFLRFDVKENDEEDYHEFIFSKDYVDLVNDHLFDAYIEIVYQIFKEKNVLNTLFKVTPKNDSYFSLTSHLYFNLSQNDNILKHKLFIDSDKIGRLDDDLILINYDKCDKIYDFSKGKLIGENIQETSPISTRGYDHPFLFKEKTDANNPRIVLTGKDYELKIFTDLTGAYIYTNNYSEPIEIVDRGQDIKYGAVAIEPQIEPFNFEKMFIEKDKTRINFIRYEFEEVE